MPLNSPPVTITPADVLSALDASSSPLSLHAIAVKLTGDPAPSDKAKRAVAEALFKLLEQGVVRRFDQDLTFYERVDPSIGSRMPTAPRINPDDPDGLLEPLLEKNPRVPASQHGFRRPLR